jgi:hypothetical protein
VAGGTAQIQLSPTEFKLLRYFMGNANRVLSKMQILDHVWDYDFRGDTGIVESYVSVLRRKVDSAEPHCCTPSAGSATCSGSRPRRNLTIMAVTSGPARLWKATRGCPAAPRCASS